MSAWIPSDDQLDALARGLPPLVPAAQRAEQTRTSLLAGAASTPQQSQRSAKAVIAAIALPLAAAAALAIWIGTRPAVTPARDTVVSLGAAKVMVANDWPDRVVRLDEGALEVDVHTLDVHERFRVRAPNGEIESRDAGFKVNVRSDRIASVNVSRGRVEVRVVGTAPVIIAAGQSWTAPITAQRDVIVPKPETPTSPDPTGSEPVERKPIKMKPTAPLEPKPTESKPNRTVVAKRSATSLESPAKTETAPMTVEPKAQPETPPDVQQPSLPSPGEAEFRAGMIAWRNGDAGAAAASFATACSTAQAALAEDACFWIGAAARRASQIATARDALARFLQRFPSSSRAGEAAALLGWILFEAGDLDGADRRFKQAANDRVPKVRESATRGLTAVDRKRSK